MPRITKDSNDKSNKIIKNEEEKKSVKKETEKKKKSTTSKAKVTTKKATSKTSSSSTSSKKTNKKLPTVSNKKDLKVVEKKEKSIVAKTKKITSISVIDTIKSMIPKKKKTSKSSTNSEYYDLPYNYNETIVKILAQTPKKLFVYWDVSLKDIENYKKAFGDDFFNTTYPVLIIHNEDKNYSFEVPVNDFANSWYIDIDDSKCKYSVDFGRKFKTQVNIINTETLSEEHINLQNDYLFISNSNKIESPNDHILFEKYNYSTPIKYKNVKTQEISQKHLKDLPLSKNYPYGSNLGVSDIYNEIYELDGSKMEVLFNLNNPSSGGNPSSGNPSSNIK